MAALTFHPSLASQSADDECSQTWRGGTMLASSFMGLLLIGAGIGSVFYGRSPDCPYACADNVVMGKKVIITGSAFLTPAAGLFAERISCYVLGKEPPSWTLTSARELRPLRSIVISGENNGQ